MADGCCSPNVKPVTHIRLRVHLMSRCFEMGSLHALLVAGVVQCFSVMLSWLNYEFCNRPLPSRFNVVVVNPRHVCTSIGDDLVLHSLVERGIANILPTYARSRTIEYDRTAATPC
jgi:hypothetical protein